jgi:hypothetical protein
MPTLTFQVPGGLSRETARGLERTFMAGGPDNMPWPTKARLKSTQLLVSYAEEESGYLAAPWSVKGSGLVMGSTTTLRERQEPYNLLLELARGKVNQVRNQAADWQAWGIPLPADLQQQITNLTIQFGRASIHDPGGPPDDTNRAAQETLVLAYQIADGLAATYRDEVIRLRQEASPKLETAFACRLATSIPEAQQGAEVVRSFNTVALPISWNQVEAEETVYNWQPQDALLQWALAQGLHVVAGPLIDFSSAQLPAWLWMWEKDLPSLATFMCRFVESAVRRYGNRIRRWQVTAGSNCAAVLSLTEEQLLGLNYRLIETVRQVDPGLEVSIGIAQPWGEYMALTERTHSPYLFADTLIRSGLTLSALDVELVMGPNPRGSYCRDLLEASRLLDLYALLGLPLRVTLGYPSDDGPDMDADPELNVSSGQWHEGFTPQTQADWSSSFAALALCKPRVQCVQWAHLSDAEAHQFPNCGLVDAKGNVKPALGRLRELREKYLR